MQIQRDVMVPMRDGVRLACDIYLPDTTTGPWPVLVARSPYSRLAPLSFLDPERATAGGYAVVMQDCRGRFGSEGEWDAHRSEPADGFDTLTWVRDQPFSNGQTATFGMSYLGYTQLAAAVEQPPGLVAMAPMSCTPDLHGRLFNNGAYALASRLSWAMTVVGQQAARLGVDDPNILRIAELMIVAALQRGQPEADEAAAEMNRLMRPFFDRLPLTDVGGLDRWAPWLVPSMLATHPTDPYWDVTRVRPRLDLIDLPALHVTGWYDLFTMGTIENFNTMRSRAQSDRARSSQHLVVGPWTHGAWNLASTKVGELDFGAAAGIDLTELQLAFFDRQVQGRSERGSGLDAPVRIFVMGANRWRDEEAFPLARTRPQRWHLRAGGRLTPEPPSAEEAPDRYRYDPSDPTPSLGGAGLGLGTPAGPMDQRAIEARSDVLTYTSDALGEPMELTGFVRVDLWAASSATDTDFTAKLVDVHPDGRAINLRDGIVRARRRFGAEREIPLVPGSVASFAIELGATSIVLSPGHRIRVEIASAAYPEYDANRNTGAPFAGDLPDDGVVADQTIFHDAFRPSSVVLPIIPLG